MWDFRAIGISAAALSGGWENIVGVKVNNPPFRSSGCRSHRKWKIKRSSGRSQMAKDNGLGKKK